LISWSDQPFPSGSAKNAKREPGLPSGPSCLTSVISTPLPASSARAASMSSTTSCKPLVLPGSPSGRPRPITTEVGEPRGRELRHRYLSLALQALRAPGAQPLPGSAATEADLTARWRGPAA
jgi:hypothetical protein